MKNVDTISAVGFVLAFLRSRLPPFGCHNRLIGDTTDTFSAGTDVCLPEIGHFGEDHSYWIEEPEQHGEFRNMNL